MPQAQNCEPRFAMKMYQEHVARYLFASQICRGRNVLDVGCGVGYGSHVLAMAGAARVLAFDISEEAVNHAREFYLHPSLEFRVASANGFAFEEKFDVITCFELIEHVPDYMGVLSRISEALSSTGCAIISTPRRLDQKRSAFHTQEFSPFEFHHILTSRFQYVKMFFENNHFTSLVADSLPTTLDRVHFIEPQLSYSTSDYMIAIVSHEELDLSGLAPQMVVNSDAYVLNLERDIAILRRANDDFAARIADLEQHVANVEARRNSLERELGETKALSVEHDQLQRESLQMLSDIREASAEQNVKLQTELEQAREHARLAETALQAALKASMQSEEAARTLVAERDLLSKELTDVRDACARNAARLQGELEDLRRENAELRHAAEVKRQRRQAEESLVAVVTGLVNRTDTEAAAKLRQASEKIRELSQTELLPSTNQVLDLYSALHAAREEAEASAVQFDTLADRVETLEASLKASNWQVASLERKLAQSSHAREDEADAHMMAVVRYARALRDHVSAVEVRFYELYETALEQSKVIEAYHAQLAEVTSSKSWKITAPVRALGGGGLTAKSVAACPARIPLPQASVPPVPVTPWPDEQEYLVANPDVVAAVQAGYFSSGFDHYLRTGWTEICDGRRRHYRAGRPVQSPVTASSPVNLPSRGFVDVLYIIGCHDGESKRYRVFNLMEFLSTRGYSAVAVSENEIPHLISVGIQAHRIVIFRSAWNDEIASIIRYARNRGIEVIFDVDDLIFEPDSIEYIRVLSTFTPEQVAGYRSDLERYRRAAAACDVVTCTTQFLADRASLLGNRAEVIPNSINARQMELAEALNTRHNTSDGAIRIGYFSGSNTHQVDFAACEQALLQIMERYPLCRFVLVGILDLGPSWDRFANRIERHPFVPYTKMLELLANCDINLAPLELGNPYCDSKSQLKIFEAGLVYVPTVASATASYCEAIDHGVDGFVASTSDDWFVALSRLVESPDLRRRLAVSARERSLFQFGLEAVGTRAIEVYGLNTARRNIALTELKRLQTGAAKPMQAANRKLKIAWIVPGLIIGGGGHRNILRAAYHLEKFGHQLELHFTDIDMDTETLVRTVREHFYPIDCPMQKYNGHIGPADVLFATHWTTVNAALQARSNVGEVMYFVQDFEPSFAPMGSEYILAENTYRQGLYCITSGPWCEVTLRRDFNLQADHFRFPVDRSVYYPRVRKSKRPTVLFFAKPEMPRRCYEIGIIALEHLHRRRPDVEIVLYGSRQLEQRSFPFPATVRSIVPTIDDLAHMYSNADVGIVFSTTNPSLVPYEMMACGLPVVDLNRPGNEINYDNRRDLALLADPSPELMAFQICELLDDPLELASRSRKGIEFVKEFPSEEEMARRVEELILNRLEMRQTDMEASEEIHPAIACSA